MDQEDNRESQFFRVRKTRRVDTLHRFFSVAGGFYVLIQTGATVDFQRVFLYRLP